MTTTTTYLTIISDILDIIAEMRESGNYDDNTLETIENRLEKM
jgi:hypothetical protein